MADVIGTPGKALKVTITMTDGQTTSFVIPPGNEGKSAYELAKEAGYVGDEAQWLADLHGTKEIKAIKVTRVTKEMPVMTAQMAQMAQMAPPLSV